MTTPSRWLRSTLALTVFLGATAPAFAQKDEKAAAPAAAPPAATAPADAPRIAFDKDTIDLGDVVKGDKANFVFTFKNTGKRDLEIQQAKPSCGCTVAEFTKKVAPNETGKVTASVDTSRFRGPITKTVTVTSNDLVTGTITLQAKANVKTLIDISPSENVYFRIFRGDDQPTKRVLAITSDAENAFEIAKVESSNPAIVTSLVNNNKDTKEPKQGANYSLEVDVKKDAPIGVLSGTVTLTTTHKKMASLVVNVNGQVLGEILITPAKVYLGQVTAETAPQIKRTVRIERRTGDGFKVEKVESTNPTIKVELSPVQDGKVYTLTISVAGELKPGALNANVTVQTNDKEQPSIEIPVVGTIGT